MNPHPKKVQTVLVLGACISLALPLWAGGVGSAVYAQEGARKPRSQVVQLQPSLVERLRRLLNITPPVAVGGSRSRRGRESMVCMISPLIRSTSTGMPMAQTSMLRPTLLAAGELNELRIERNGQILWRQQAKSTQALAGPIPWPLDPLRPGERVTVWLRPRGSAGGDFATFDLLAGNSRQQQQAAALLSDPRGRIAAVQTAANAGDEQLALELLYAPLDPVSPAVAQLRLELAKQACSLGSGTSR